MGGGKHDGDKWLLDNPCTLIERYDAATESLYDAVTYSGLEAEMIVTNGHVGCSLQELPHVSRAKGRGLSARFSGDEWWVVALGRSLGRLLGANGRPDVAVCTEF